MKKQVIILVAALMAVAIAVPAFAAVEFQYGGQFRARFTSDNNVYDGTSQPGYYGSNYTSSNDNARWIDQRTRLYFSFIASPNLKVVTKFELGTTAWGMGPNTGSSVGNTGANAGGNVGADAVSVEVKNAYMQFNIPGTPTTAIIGVQGVDLLDSWIIDDDIPAALFVTKLDPFKVTLGYVGGQYGWERNAAFSASNLPLTNASYNVDDFVGVVDFAQGPFKASLIGVFQDAHNSSVSIDPQTMSSPVRNYEGYYGDESPRFFTGTTWPRNNYLFDLGFNLTYKVDYLLAYVNFVKNLGSADIYNTAPTVSGGSPNSVKLYTANYTGYMVDAGVTYFCGPWTANIGGFYTSGPSISSNPVADMNGRFLGITSNNINWFTYPLATDKYFSEIMGGGILGDDIPGSGYVTRGFLYNTKANALTNPGATVRWYANGFTTNLWTITAGGSYQIAEQTKVSGSYWYFGNPSAVPVAFSGPVSQNAQYKMSSSVGHELDVYLDQGIVDGLTLTLVGAYLFADDAFCPLPFGAPTGNPLYLTPHADDAWELGARLLWNF
jgi:hypothetical protein